MERVMDRARGTSPAPRGARAVLAQIGPGLILTASIVGSGELIVTTGLGARAGFILLWLIVLGCVVKVFIQLELGRHAISEGITTLKAMDLLPGPRWVVSWLVWLWLVMFVSIGFQMGGILGGLAQVLAGAGFPGSEAALAAAVSGVTALLLAGGRYVLIERLSVLLVFLFTACTVLAAVLLQWTPYALKAADVLEGLQFRLPESFVWAFAAFGITGVGASELIYYPYWCLEKGYARNVGPREDAEEWAERARGWIRVMGVDAWTSLAVYTTVTAAFYLLGAAVLHPQGLVVRDEEMIPTLSKVYRETFGPLGLPIFHAGAFAVLYSTFLVATASNARLLADALPLFRLHRYRSEAGRTAAVRAGSVLLAASSFLLFACLRTPVSLVMVGAVAQAVMLPLLALLALYLHHRRTDRRLRPGAVWTGLLWFSFCSMAAIGIYQALEKLLPLLKPAP